MVAILGIAGAIVVPSMLKGGTLGVQAAARTVVADLMYAQNDAIAQQSPRRVVFDTTGQSYRLTDARGDTLHASWLGGDSGSGNYEVDFTDDQRFLGVELVSADFAGDSVIAFDDLGAPDQGGVVELRYEDRTYRITVASFTGRITVEKVGS